VNRSPATWKARHFVGVIVEGIPTAGMVNETMLLRGPADKSRQSRRGIFLTDRLISFCAEQSPGRERWSSPRPEARGAGEEREGKGENRGFTELLKRRRGTNAPLS
jgi:hypothetical protein